jgi:hypothetical protein
MGMALDELEELLPEAFGGSSASGVRALPNIRP